MNTRRKQELLKLEAEHLENARFLNRADVVIMTESDEDERFSCSLGIYFLRSNILNKDFLPRFLAKQPQNKYL